MVLAAEDSTSQRWFTFWSEDMVVIIRPIEPKFHFVADPFLFAPRVCDSRSLRVVIAHEMLDLRVVHIHAYAWFLEPSQMISKTPTGIQVPASSKLDRYHLADNYVGP